MGTLTNLSSTQSKLKGALDANAELAFTVAFQCLMPIRRTNPKIVQRHRIAEAAQFATRHPLD